MTTLAELVPNIKVLIEISKYYENSFKNGGSIKYLSNFDPNATPEQKLQREFLKLRRIYLESMSTTDVLKIVSLMYIGRDGLQNQTFNDAMNLESKHQHKEKYRLIEQLNEKNRVSKYLEQGIKYSGLIA